MHPAGEWSMRHLQRFWDEQSITLPRVTLHTTSTEVLFLCNQSSGCILLGTGTFLFVAQEFAKAWGGMIFIQKASHNTSCSKYITLLKYPKFIFTLGHALAK